MSQSPASSDEPFVRLAEIEFNAGRAGKAQRVLESGKQFWPRSAEIHDRLAGIHFQSGRLSKAREAIRRAVQLAPGNPIYRAHQQQILSRQ